MSEQEAELRIEREAFKVRQCLFWVLGRFNVGVSDLLSHSLQSFAPDEHVDLCLAFVDGIGGAEQRDALEAFLCGSN